MGRATSCNGAYAIKACVLSYLGRPEEAIEFAQYAVRLTPAYPAEFPAILAGAYYDSGRYMEAISATEASPTWMAARFTDRQ